MAKRRFLWRITKDIIGEGEQNGYSNTDDKNTVLKDKFRLYDDDGILYFEGESNNQDQEAAFIPLDWAMGNYGCTYIEYRDHDTGRWEIL